MVTPHNPSGSYSAWLRAKRQRRGRPKTSAGNSVQVGSWLLADEDGALVIIHRKTGARTVLMNGGGLGGSV